MLINRQHQRAIYYCQSEKVSSSKFIFLPFVDSILKNHIVTYASKSRGLLCNILEYMDHRIQILMQASDLQHTTATYLLRILQSIFRQIVSREDCFSEFTFLLLICECVALHILNVLFLNIFFFKKKTLFSQII